MLCKRIDSYENVDSIKEKGRKYVIWVYYFLSRIIFISVRFRRF